MDRVAPQVHRLGRPHSSVGDDVRKVPLLIQAIERPYGEEPILNECRRTREIAGMRTPVGPSDYGATWIVCLEASGAGRRAPRRRPLIRPSRKVERVKGIEPSS
jgi:hypothetical protein